MTNRNKFTIIDKIENDAPYGNINYCTISFITPTKVEKTKYLDMYGFKVHNGYNTFELSDVDAVKIKNKNKNHDVYLAELGKLYAWDDATKSDSLQYDNSKLNDLEKTRRENVDKIKLMSETYKNEFKPMPNKNKNRQEAQLKKMQKKLYEKGLISKTELDMLNEESRPANSIKEEASAREIMDKEMEEAMTIDYLDENDPIGLKFGCITLFIPNNIKGLQTMCFKIRGLFQTLDSAKKRSVKLEKLYPRDQIHIFEIGKWCPFVCGQNVDDNTQLMRLNYAMKCYLENLVDETEKFEERQKELVSKNTKETNENKNKNDAEQNVQKFKSAKEKRKERKKQNKMNETQHNNSETTNESGVSHGEVLNTEPQIVSSGNDVDDENIKSILNFLNDPELNEIMAKKKNVSTSDDVMVVNV